MSSPSSVTIRTSKATTVVLLPHTDREGAQRAIERAREQLTETETEISFSVGIIQLDRTVGSIDDLVGKADELMYEAKRAHRQATGVAPPAGRNEPVVSA